MDCMHKQTHLNPKIYSRILYSGVKRGKRMSMRTKNQISTGIEKHCNVRKTLKKNGYENGEVTRKKMG